MRALIPVIVGVGLMALAFRTRAGVGANTFAPASLTNEEFRQFELSDGSLNLDPAYKPAENTQSDNLMDFSLFGAPQGLGNYSEEFDWGAWATATEDWGAQTISLPNEYLPTEDEIQLMDADTLIQEIAAHLMQKEGFRGHIYDDLTGKPWTNSKRGKPTIGYGHLVTQNDLANHGWGWTMDEHTAYVLLLNDVNSHLAPIIPAVTVPLTINQWIVIASLAFQVGPAIVKRSRFLRSLNAMNLAQAEIEFKDFNKVTIEVDGQRIKRVVPGIVNRREQEWALFTVPQQVVMIEGAA